jgi:protein-S-isoprenylcysteine O-methyltransferase Ste14
MRKAYTEEEKQKVAEEYRAYQENIRKRLPGHNAQ